MPFTCTFMPERIWLVDGMFPAAKSLEEEANEAEERRLFYVAVTRAKDYLWLCAPRMRKARDGGVMMCMPSRFLDEIDPDLLQIDKASGFAPTLSCRRSWKSSW